MERGIGGHRDREEQGGTYVSDVAISGMQAPQPTLLHRQVLPEEQFWGHMPGGEGNSRQCCL